MSPVRRKILLMIPSLAGGGAERVFSLLLTHLDRACFELHLGILQDQGEYMSDVPGDVVVHRLDASRVRYVLPGLLSLIWKLRPSTVVSTLGHMNVVLLLTRPFMPSGTRIVIREAVIQSAAVELDTRHPRLYKWLFRQFYKRANAVICLSDSMVDDMMEHFNVPREKLVRIYNPVDVKRVQELGAFGGNPYPTAGPNLIAVGRMARQKGFDVLLNALPAVIQSVPGTRLTLLGQGSLRSELEAQSRKLGLTEHVDFVGFQNNPWRYMKYADLFVLPSRFEGLPNALLEALALGLRVIASDCPGAVREVQHYFKEVILVPPDDSQALANAIISVSSLVAEDAECRRPPPSFTLSPFDLSKVIGQYSKLFLR